MIEPHVHCAECLKPIATKILCAHGKTKDVEIATGTQFSVIPGPQGLGVLPRPVPLCPDCLERLKKEEQEAAAASKIIVPKLDASVPTAGTVFAADCLTKIAGFLDEQNRAHRETPP